MIANSLQTAQNGERDRLRLLDACLNELETAHERGESTVSAMLEARLLEQVPQVTTGMPISKAMGLVFREQERCILRAGPGRNGGHRPGLVVQRADAQQGLAVAPPDALDLDRLEGIIRQTREMIRYVDNARDAALLVRRANASEKLIDEALKSCQFLEEEQFELKQDVAEAHLWTQRRAGELLGDLDKHRGGRRPATAPNDKEVSAKPPTLRQLGISANESHRWQLIAGLPADRFEGYIAETRAMRRELTTARVLALANRLRRGDEAGRPVPEQRASAAIDVYEEAKPHLRNLVALEPEEIGQAIASDRRPQELDMLRRLREWIDSMELVLTA
jgi:hypothetical protein